VTLRGVAFGGAEWAGQIDGAGGSLNIAFRPVINTFGGRRTVEMHVLDWQPAEQMAALSTA
jgi:single-stranded-DNA-specific exonuclease